MSTISVFFIINYEYKMFEVVRILRCDCSTQAARSLQIIIMIIHHITLCSLTFHRKSTLNLICLELITMFGFYLDSFAMVRSRSTTFSYNVKRSLLTFSRERKPTSQKSTHAQYTTRRENGPRCRR